MSIWCCCQSPSRPSTPVQNDDTNAIRERAEAQLLTIMAVVNAPTPKSSPGNGELLPPRVTENTVARSDANKLAISRINEWANHNQFVVVEKDIYAVPADANDLNERQQVGVVVHPHRTLKELTSVAEENIEHTVHRAAAARKQIEGRPSAQAMNDSLDNSGVFPALDEYPKTAPQTRENIVFHKDPETAPHTRENNNFNESIDNNFIGGAAQSSSPLGGKNLPGMVEEVSE